MPALYPLFLASCFWPIDLAWAVPMASMKINDVVPSQTDLSENESANLTAFYIPCIVIVVTCMVLRVLSRRVINEPLKADDFTLLWGAV
jgi:hypothetical protein